MWVKQKWTIPFLISVYGFGLSKSGLFRFHGEQRWNSLWEGLFLTLDRYSSYFFTVSCSALVDGGCALVFWQPPLLLGGKVYSTSPFFVTIVPIVSDCCSKLKVSVAQ